MCDTPTVYRQSAVRGRKDHRCDECFRTIPKEEIHEYAFGIWNNDVGYYRTCAPCVEIRQDLQEMMETDGAMYQEEIYCALAHGLLADAMQEWCLG